MKRFVKKNGKPGKILVVDRRNVGNPTQLAFEIAMIEESKEQMLFLATWDFPTPAVRRRYYFRDQELTIEELGKERHENRYLFSGRFFGVARG